MGCGIAHSCIKGTVTVELSSRGDEQLASLASTKEGPRLQAKKTAVTIQPHTSALAVSLVSRRTAQGKA